MRLCNLFLISILFSLPIAHAQSVVATPEAKITKLHTHWGDRRLVIVLEGVNPADYNPGNCTATTYFDQGLGLDDKVLDIQAAMLMSAFASDQKVQLLIRDCGLQAPGIYAVRMNK